MPEIVLPPLDKDCPHCTPEEVQKQKAAEFNAWNDEEQAAFRKFAATYTPEWGAHEAWKQTDTYYELRDREPEPAGVGCVECDWTQRVLTDAGRQVLDFVDRWRSKQ
jgi:hypothetical protein